ncbi:MAG: glycosyltransferase [bacterium]
MCYIIHPFLINKKADIFFAHTNIWRALEIARIIGEFGYIVDGISYDDYDSKISDNYDLLIGFGRACVLAKRLSEQTVKLYIATESEATIHNRRESESLERLNNRRSCNLTPMRKSYKIFSNDLKYFDAIACLGNKVTADTYRPFFKKKIYCFNNHGYDHNMGLSDHKNFKTARRKFLFFGSIGQVLFGLDLLLEVFAKKPLLDLFVCGPFEKEKEFIQCYWEELYNKPNIHPVGWVSLKSKIFSDLMKKCGMVIVPICSGASTGSVIVCMGKGLIPIVTKEAGIDTDDFGITLSSSNLKDIDEKIEWISNQPAKWHEEMHYKVLKAAQRDFSQEAFTRRFTEIFKNIIINNNTGSIAQIHK